MTAIQTHHICFHLALLIILSDYLSIFSAAVYELREKITRKGLRIEDWSKRWREQHDEACVQPMSLCVYCIYLCSSRHWQMRLLSQSGFRPWSFLFTQTSKCENKTKPKNSRLEHSLCFLVKVEVNYTFDLTFIAECSHCEYLYTLYTKVIMLSFLLKTNIFKSLCGILEFCHQKGHRKCLQF